MDHSAGKELPPVVVESFENVPGRGLLATVNRTKVMQFVCVYISFGLYCYLFGSIQICKIFSTVSTRLQLYWQLLSFTTAIFFL